MGLTDKILFGVNSPPENPSALSKPSTFSGLPRVDELQNAFTTKSAHRRLNTAMQQSGQPSWGLRTSSAGQRQSNSRPDRDPTRNKLARCSILRVITRA